jgi:hypothetical protein
MNRAGVPVGGVDPSQGFGDVVVQLLEPARQPRGTDIGRVGAHHGNR